MASITYLVPTIGRESLTKTIESISVQLHSGDSIILLEDQWLACGGLSKDDQTLIYGCCRNIVPCHGPHNDWGGYARNIGCTIATGDYLAFLDDDDVCLPRAVDTIHAAIDSEINRVPHVFRMWRKPMWDLPDIRVIQEGTISTQMFVVPNDKSRLGEWSNRYGNDYDFIRSTVDKYPNKDAGVVWHAEMIAHWNGGR